MAISAKSVTIRTSSGSNGVRGMMVKRDQRNLIEAGQGAIEKIISKFQII